MKFDKIKLELPMSIEIVERRTNGSTFSGLIDYESFDKVMFILGLFKDIKFEDLHTVLSSDRGRLALAVLINPLESVPLVAMIDELQNTEEFQRQNKHHPKYKDMYDILIDIGNKLYKTCGLISDRIISIEQNLIARRIAILLAPCSMCKGKEYVEYVYIHDEFIKKSCPACDHGYERGFYDTV